MRLICQSSENIRLGQRCISSHVCVFISLYSGIVSNCPLGHFVHLGAYVQPHRGGRCFDSLPGPPTRSISTTYLLCSHPHPCLAVSLPSIEIQIPRRQEQQDQITRNERRVDAQIAPAVSKAEFQGLEELIPDFIRAVATDVADVADDVAGTAPLEELGHVPSTILPAGGGETVQFVGLADHGVAVQFRRDHA